MLLHKPQPEPEHKPPQELLLPPVMPPEPGPKLEHKPQPQLVLPPVLPPELPEQEPKLLPEQGP